MNKIRFTLLLLASFMMLTLSAQSKSQPVFQPERPKLVVGIVVDQMRYDYLYRYMNKYGEGGFKRLLRDGFSCENMMINYIPSVTGVGHSVIFSGSVPALSGIAGNEWIDYSTDKPVYCVSDPSVTTVGAPGDAGQMSPHFLEVTTITDELRLATNFHSKVVGVSLKDRASILPAGHNPNGAFWFDDASGRFITSSYYMNKLPGWVDRFNSANEPQDLMNRGWNTLLPIADYTESTADDVSWEGTLPGCERPVFPYDTKKAYQIDRGSLRETPYGNTLTLDFAKAAVDGYELGQGENCDFLTINCASTDYAGHMFGPNSVEVEDVYLRLDRDLSGFFNYLDKKIGKGKYVVFLTADHGAAHAGGFMESHKMPMGWLKKSMMGELNSALNDKFHASRLVLGFDDYQVYFNLNRIDSLDLNMKQIKSFTIDFLKKQDGIQFVVDQDKIAEASVPEPLKEMMINGYNSQRSGAVLFIPKSGYLPGNYRKGTTHSVWNPYDTHIPFLMMGWNIQHGSTHQRVEMTDISATVAALLHIQMPSGCIGKPIVPILAN